MRTHSVLSLCPCAPRGGAPPTRGAPSVRGSPSWPSPSALAALVPTQQTTDADYRLGESGRADAMVAAGHFPDGQVESVLVTARDGGAPARDDVAQAAAAAADASLRPGRRRRVCRRRSGTPRATPPSSTSTSQDSVDDPAAVQAVTAAVARDHPGLDLREAGDVSVDDAINTRVAEDLHSAEGISLPDHASC